MIKIDSLLISKKYKWVKWNIFAIIIKKKAHWYLAQENFKVFVSSFLGSIDTSYLWPKTGADEGDVIKYT